MTPTEGLFEVPAKWWATLRRCLVCGGNLDVHAEFTYILQRQRYIKIGKTSQLEQRLYCLTRPSTGCLVRMPDDMDVTRPLVLRAVFAGDIEHELHRRFAAAHAAGEWFRSTPELDEYAGSEWEWVGGTRGSAGMAVEKVGIRLPLVA